MWFDTQAEEAARFFVSVFNIPSWDPLRTMATRGAKTSGMPKGSVMTVTFEPDGQEFVALNGGPLFKITEAVSLMVKCHSQEEIDTMWTKVSESEGHADG